MPAVDLNPPYIDARYSKSVTINITYQIGTLEALCGLYMNLR